MADKEARIRIGIENASQTIADLSKIQGGFRGLGMALEGVKRLAVDVGKAIAEVKPLKPVQATNEAEKYRDQITRLSIAMGMGAKATDYLQARLEQIGQRIKISAPDVAGLAHEYGKLTYDFKGAVESMEDLGRLGNQIGKPMGEMISIGASLHNKLGVPLTEVSSMIVRFGEIAQNVGTVGGRNAFLDTIQGLGGAMERFNVKTDKARERLAAFVGLVGRGLPQGQAQEAAGGALGWISGDALGLGRYLGRKILIHDGKVDDPIEILQAIRKKIGATRNRAAALRVLANYTSPEAAQNLAALSDLATDDALYGARESATARKAGLRGTGAYDLSKLTPEQREAINERMRLQIGDDYSSSAAGKLSGARIERENAERGIGQKLLKGRDYYEGSKSAIDKIADDTMIDMAGDVPIVGGALKTGATIARGVDALSESRVPQAAAPARTDEILQNIHNEQKETNRVLRQQGGDRNARDVDSRKRGPAN